MFVGAQSCHENCSAAIITVVAFNIHVLLLLEKCPVWNGVRRSLVNNKVCIEEQLKNDGLLNSTEFSIKMRD